MATDTFRRAPVPYTPVRCRCPKCGEPNPRVVKSPKRPGAARIRYHRCRCGWSGKSVEG